MALVQAKFSAFNITCLICKDCVFCILFLILLLDLEQ